MSRVLLLDLGETLIHNMSVFPHVPEALQALSAFKDEKGKRLQLALVSDTDMPTAPVTAAKIKAIFDRYVSTLDALNLRGFFDPVAKHATISAQAGALKPDRKVFALAVKRLGVSAKLTDCIFVTENADHIRHCRESLGMKALQFGKEFTDWSEAPLILAPMINPASGNLAIALEPWAAARGLESVSLVASNAGPDVMQAHAQELVPLSGSDLQEAEGAYVPIPVRIDLRRDANGRIRPNVLPPSPDDVTEAASYVKGLVARGEIGDKSGSLATHKIEVDGRGRRRLKRVGFKSAI